MSLKSKNNEQEKKSDQIQKLAGKIWKGFPRRKIGGKLESQYLFELINIKLYGFETPFLL